VSKKAASLLARASFTRIGSITDPIGYGSYNNSHPRSSADVIRTICVLSTLQARSSLIAGSFERFLYCHLISFLVPAILATNYTVNRFYVLGAPMWDSGWFAHLASTGLRNPPAIGGLFLSDHMSLVLGVFALTHQLTPSVAAPVFFAFAHGLWFGVIGLAASLCLAPWLQGMISVPLAILCALNGISLATIGFPHIEIAIPALILLILALWTHGHRLGAWPFVPLLLSVREDAGLHLATIFALIAACRWRQHRHWQAGQAEAVLALTGAAGSSAIWLTQEMVFVAGVDQLHDTYLGTPIFHHVDWQFLGHRLSRLGQNRSYIYLPCFLTLVVAMCRRSWLLAIGPLAGLPWVVLALVARSPVAGELMSYYGFPLMVGLCWPMIAAQQGFGLIDRSIAIWLLATNMMLSVVLFAASGCMHDRRPWNSFWFPNTTLIAATESALDELLAHRVQLGPIIVDDAVGSLRPSAFGPAELRALMAFSATETEALNVLIFQPTSWLAARKQEIIAAAGLMSGYRMRRTRLLIYSKSPLYGLNGLEPIER